MSSKEKKDSVHKISENNPFKVRDNLRDNVSIFLPCNHQPISSVEWVIMITCSVSVMYCNGQH